FKVEAVAIITKRAAVNLKDERIFFRGIEIGRLHDPALNFALVLRGLVSDFFDMAGLLLIEEFLIKTREDFARPPGADGDVARYVRAAIGEGDGAGMGYGERAAAVRAG